MQTALTVICGATASGKSGLTIARVAPQWVWRSQRAPLPSQTLAPDLIKLSVPPCK